MKVEEWMRVKDPEAIKRLRKRRGFTQTELAFLIKRSQSTVQLIESGGMKTVSTEVGLELSRRLDVDWEDLFEKHRSDDVSKIANYRRTIVNESKVPA